MSDKQWAAVCRLGGIGDNLIASSILPLLAEDYQVEFICQEPYHVVLQNNPFISKLTVKKSDDFPSGGGLEWQQWFASRAKEYAKFVHLSHSCETTLALVPAQTQFYWPAEMRRKWCGRNYLEFVHDIARLPHKFAPKFYPTAEEHAKAVEKTNETGPRVIGWCLSGSRLDKIYPQSAMVIARLLRELNTPVRMFGAPGRDFEIAKEVLNLVTKQNGTHEGLHLALSPDPDKPSWPVRRVLTQLQTCDLVIGPDTGPLWSVSMEDMPKIVLLSHASAENITKHWLNTVSLHADPIRVPCYPCHRLHDDPQKTCVPNADNTGAACISDISAETIVQTAARLLTERGNKHLTKDT